MAATDVVCIGETMALVAPDPPVPLAEARQLVLSPGGAESNVALWLARLGSHAQWCGRVGADPLGARVLADLAASGVGLDSAVTDPAAPTAVYFKDPGPRSTSVWYYRSGSAGSRLDCADVDRALALRPGLIHVSGITPALSDSCAQALDHALSRAGAAGITISFDVNYRAALWPSAGLAAGTLLALAERADVVFVGLDEARLLWGTDRPAEVRARLTRPAELIVTDGPRAVTGYRGAESVRVPALAVPVAEPVGAGDAFAAGWLRGRLLGWAPVECLRLGHLLAGAALRSATDHGALPAAPAALEALAVSGELWRASTAAAR